jgi:hypothetical protein
MDALKARICLIESTSTLGKLLQSKGTRQSQESISERFQPFTSMKIRKINAAFAELADEPQRFDS